MMRAHRCAMFVGGGRYRPVYGIKTDGTAYCVIDHIHSSSRSRFEIDLTKMSLERGDSHIFGAHGDVDALVVFHTVADSTSAYGIYCAPSFANPGNFGGWKKGRHFITASNSPAEITFDGASTTQTLPRSGFPRAKMLVFAANAIGRVDEEIEPQGVPDTTCAIHSLKYWDGDELIADLHPVYDSVDGVYGFLNSVDGQFIGSCNEGRLLEYDGREQPPSPSSGNVYYCGPYGDFYETDVVVGTVVSGSVESGEFTIKFNGADELGGYDGEALFNLYEHYSSEGYLADVNIYGDGTFNWYAVDGYWFDIYLKAT